MRRVNLMTGEISLCHGCGCMTNDILGSDGIYCGKCKSPKHAQNKNEHTSKGCGKVFVFFKEDKLTITMDCGTSHKGRTYLCKKCSSKTSSKSEDKQ